MNGGHAVHPGASDHRENKKLEKTKQPKPKPTMPGEETMKTRLGGSTCT